MKIKAIYYGLDDGFGVVGYGYVCPRCKINNEFVDETETDHKCSGCGRIIPCVQHHTSKVTFGQAILRDQT